MGYNDQRSDNYGQVIDPTKFNPYPAPNTGFQPYENPRREIPRNDSRYSMYLFGHPVEKIEDANNMELPQNGAKMYYPTSDGERIFTKRLRSDYTVDMEEYVKVDSAHQNWQEQLFRRLESMEEEIRKLREQNNRKNWKNNKGGNQNGQHTTYGAAIAPEQSQDYE